MLSQRALYVSERFQRTGVAEDKFELEIILSEMDEANLMLQSVASETYLADHYPEILGNYVDAEQHQIILADFIKSHGGLLSNYFVDPLPYLNVAVKDFERAAKSESTRMTFSFFLLFISFALLTVWFQIVIVSPRIRSVAILKQKERTAQNRRSIAERRLEEANRRFLEVAENTSAWVWEQNEFGVFTYLSKGVEKAIGYKPELWLGRTRRDVMAMMDLPEHDWTSFDATIYRQDRLTGFVYPFRNRSGKLVWVRIFGEAFYDSQGSFRGYRGTGIDVTEMQEALRASMSSERFQKSILSNLTHEVRTPLNAISGISSLSRSEKNPDQTNSNLRLIESHADDLSNTFNGLLELAKIEAGELEAVPEKTHLTDWLNECVQLYAALATEKGLNLEPATMNQGVPEYIEIDQDKMTMVVGTLLSNAIKFSSHGNIGIDVSVIEENNLQISVIDEGIGISNDDVARIFHPFEQGQFGKSRLANGLGVGLAIAKELVAAHGGTLSVESEVGRGSIFKIVLPTNLITFEQDALLEKDVNVGKVLVVDDNEINRIVICGFLEQLQIDCEQADSGAAALARCKEQSYDVIFLDISMPGMNGYETLDAIRDLAEKTDKSQGAIIAVTAHSASEDIASEQKAGFAAHITKPVNRAKLGEALSIYCGPGSDSFRVWKV